MAINSKTMDFSGLDLKADSVTIAGTALSVAEMAALDGVTAGTVTASKALVVDANKDIATLNNVTMTNLIVGASGSVAIDNTTATATGNDTTQSATVTKAAGTVTTGALTTAANAATNVVLTLTGVAAGDIILVTGAGGTNTTPVYIQSAIATTDTITVKIRNGVNSTTALNGTVAFHYLWIK